LLRKTTLTGEEKLALGDAWSDLGDYTSAETSYFGALSRGGLTADQTWRAQMGLARVAHKQGQRYSARSRYQQAWKLAPSGPAKDRALVALALVEIEDGDLASAREHRRAIADASGPDVAEIDRRLGAEKIAAVTAKSDVAAAPGGRGLPPPKINGRDSWNARPMSMKGDPEPMGKITRITLHHTADLRAVGVTFAAVAERMKAYQTGHQQTNHWADIGYHFVVDQKGRIWEGRALNWKGAHAGNKQANENNVGVALIGNFEKTDPTSAQEEATEELLSWLSLEYGVPSSRIYTHNEIEKIYGIKGTTCCPGKRFAPSLTRIKKAVDRAQGQRSGAAMH
jgi:N-acetylmuramoyl-L-alanine amidase